MTFKKEITFVTKEFVYIKNLHFIKYSRLTTNLFKRYVRIIRKLIRLYT